MRKAAFITSALLFCSPAALMADGISVDPRADIDAETEFNADADLYAGNTDIDADADFEASASIDKDVEMDGDTDYDVNANVDADVDMDTEHKTQMRAKHHGTDMDHDTKMRLKELDRVADKSMNELRSLSEPLANLADRAYGYAVFDSTKGGLLLTGTGGTGVAVNARTGEKTYMRVGGAGIGLGAGAQTFKLVLLFETEQDFDDFTNGDWNGNAAAQAVIGEAGASATADFEDGVAAFQFNQKGLMAQADITGLKFWVADSLES